LSLYPKNKFIHKSFKSNDFLRNKISPFLPLSVKKTINRLYEKIFMEENIDGNIVSYERKKKLYEFYAEDIMRLEKLLKKDLSFWQY